MFRVVLCLLPLAVAGHAGAAWGQTPCEPVGSPDVYSGWEYTLIGSDWQCRNRASGNVYRHTAAGWQYLRTEAPPEGIGDKCRCRFGLDCKCCLKCKEPCKCQTCKCDHCPGKTVGVSDGPNYGLDWHGTERARHSINGVDVTEAEAVRAISGNDVPDDAHLLRITVIGTEAERAAVLRDLAATPELRPWREKAVALGYEPTHWHVADAGFRTDGHPTIYVQAPGGRVIHRQDDYRDGPKGLAKALNRAERRADPAYDPSHDPDLRKDIAPDAMKHDGKLPLQWIMAGIAAALAFFTLRAATRKAV